MAMSGATGTTLCGAHEAPARGRGSRCCSPVAASVRSVRAWCPRRRRSHDPCVKLCAMVRERRAGQHRRHDADAGGDREALAAKAALREQIWADLDRPGVARFPKPANRIPNFVGAEAAARRLADTDEWAGGIDGEVEPRLAAVAGASARAPGRQGRVHGGATARRARSLLPARPGAPGRRPADRQLDQGRRSQRAHRQHRRARAGGSRRHRVCRCRRGGRSARQRRRLQRPRARGSRGSRPGRTPTPSSSRRCTSGRCSRAATCPRRITISTSTSS